jgi:hypothetical protein
MLETRTVTESFILTATHNLITLGSTGPCKMSSKFHSTVVEWLREVSPQFSPGLCLGSPSISPSGFYLRAIVPGTA